MIQALGFCVQAAERSHGGVPVGKHRGKTAPQPGGITQPPTSTEYYAQDINPWYLQQQLDNVPRLQHADQCIRTAREVYHTLFRWVDSYEDRAPPGITGFNRFALDWAIYRLGISLQMRLMVEQVLWNKGRPWSTLVTGFRPASTPGR